MNTLAIILARAGSKGVPGKNARMVGGRPCIAWTIDAARDAALVSRIVLSTDGAELQRIGMERGIDVVARPPDLATDTAPVDAAARHAVASLESACGSGTSPKFDPIVILYGNVPVRPPGLIDRALDLLLRSGADSVQSYAPVGKFHPWWTARLDEAGGVHPWEGEILNHGIHRRQDLPPAFIPDGGVIAVRRSALFLEIHGVPPSPHAFFGIARRGITNAEGDVIDIDTELDVIVADTVLRARASAEIPAPNMSAPGGLR